MSSNYTGIPTAAESPGIAPALGGYPLVVLPADGDALSAASVSQAYKALADFSAFSQLKINLHDLLLLRNYYLIDEDFDGTTLNVRYTLTGTGSILTDDATANGVGAIKLNPNATQSFIKSSAKLPATTGDFWIEVRARLPNAIASGDSGFILFSDAASVHFVTMGYSQGTVSNHWYAQLDSGLVQDTGVLPSATYQRLGIVRSGSTISFLINDVVKYTTTYASTIDAGKLQIQIIDGGANTAEMRIDYIKMYVQR